ncbi:hypothetical protein [Vibrio phage PhiImVa-1]|nr:hypothetical protein [Vibrio phage PhiImVa-1]
MILVETYIDEEDINDKDVIIACHVFGYLVDKWLHTEMHSPELTCELDPNPYDWMTKSKNKVSNHIWY